MRLCLYMYLYIYNLINQECDCPSSSALISKLFSMSRISWAECEEDFYSQTFLLTQKKAPGMGRKYFKLILRASSSLDLFSSDVLRCSRGLWELFERSSEPPASPIGCHFLFKELFLQLLPSAQGAEAFEIAAASLHNLLEQLASKRRGGEVLVCV